MQALLKYDAGLDHVDTLWTTYLPLTVPLMSDTN